MDGDGVVTIDDVYRIELTTFAAHVQEVHQAPRESGAERVVPCSKGPPGGEGVG